MTGLSRENNRNMQLASLTLQTIDGTLSPVNSLFAAEATVLKTIVSHGVSTDNFASIVFEGRWGGEERIITRDMAL
jgi:hypothetical protein